ncbi:MAG: radical SAM protein [Candidatus Gracilibacteria bacterium]
MTEECDNCKYKNWDCKNCFIDAKEGDNINVVFFLIMTRQCNFRCNYCAIDFSDDILGYDVIDNFINFLKNNRNKINELRLEFFGGEPLLEYEKIKYIVEHTRQLDISNYLIVTNGSLLTKEKINFLINNKIQIIFSVALHSKEILNNVELFKDIKLNNFLINFIIEPGKEILMYDIFKKLLKIGFRKFSLIPIRYTQKWSESNLINLDYLLKKIKKINDIFLINNIHLDLFTGKNNDDMEKGIGKNDFEILLDFNGKLYADYEVELYILRDLVPKEIFNIDSTIIGNIMDSDINFRNILKNRNKIKPNYHINNIGKYLDIENSDIGLGQVMRKYNINL